jgi:hypothetical protein
VLGILQDEIRLLTFRSMGPGVRTRYGSYLAFGLIATWIAGLGRHWDNERAPLWLQLGLGSLASAFVLSFVLWVIVTPLRPANWSYRNVLLFMTLTSAPMILYAIPVERFMTPDNARIANMWILAIVAIWRVALYWRFLNGAAKLPPTAATVATLLPLALIVVTLSVFNLQHFVFSMAGIDESRTAADAAYAAVWTLSTFSVVGAPLIALVYLVLIYMRHSIVEPTTTPPGSETAIARRD